MIPIPLIYQSGECWSKEGKIGTDRNGSLRSLKIAVSKQLLFEQHARFHLERERLDVSLRAWMMLPFLPVRPRPQTASLHTRLSLNLSITAIWNGAGVAPDGLRALWATYRISFGDPSFTYAQRGLVLLGAPFGGPEFVQAHLQKTLERQATLLTQLPSLHDSRARKLQWVDENGHWRILKWNPADKQLQVDNSRPSRTTEEILSEAVQLRKAGTEEEEAIHRFRSMRKLTRTRRRSGCSSRSKFPCARSGTQHGRHCRTGSAQRLGISSDVA